MLTLLCYNSKIISQLLFFILGIGVGGLGTLIGVGGGFILIPVFLYLYPEESPEKLTAYSLAIVFLNSFSGSIAYAFRKRIHYPSGVAFAAASLPGAILGTWVSSLLSRETFAPFFGSILILVSLFLLFKPRRMGDSHVDFALSKLQYLFGAILSFFVGILSSILGIGGGVIHVPAMVYLLNYPIHRATATSHFILAITTLTATLIHWHHGTLSDGYPVILFIGSGVVIGAQLGAKLSTRIHGQWIVRGIAVCLIAIAIRLLFTA